MLYLVVLEYLSMARSSEVLGQIEKRLFDSISPTPKIEVLRQTFPNNTDGQNRAILKRQDVQGLFNEFSQSSGSRVLVIGDLHAPFTLPGYLDHCEKVYRREGCNRVVQIGDALDNHASSYHESESDSMGSSHELAAARRTLKPWAESFPDALAVMGNHDRIIQRKATSSRVAHDWLRPYGEVIGVPWPFTESLEIDGVLYRHEVGSSPLAAANSALKAGQSVVGGHIHTKSGVVYLGKTFGCLTGVGVDRETYSQRYAKLQIEPYQISCAVVYQGQRAATFPMI